MFRLLAFVLGVSALLVGVPSAADAADSGPVLVGAYSGTLQLSKDWGGSAYGSASGAKTFTFGAGCRIGAACTATNTSGTSLAFTPSGQGLTYTYDGKAPCTDNQTGALRSNVAFDAHEQITFTPSATETRSGVVYVTALRGTYASSFAVNAVGRGLDCTVRPNSTQRETEAGTYQLKLAPLARPKAVASSSPLAVATPRGATATGSSGGTAATGTLPRFSLPQSSAQRDAARAVAEGRRSSVAGALVLPADAIASIKARLGKDLLLMALLGLLMVFPATLFNATYDENSERIDRRLTAMRLRRRKREQRERSRFRRVSTFVLVTLVGTLLAGFLDPKFGLNPASYALTVGVLASVVVGLVIAVVAGGLYRAGSREPLGWQLDAIASSLLFAAFCVAVSRLTGFQPGYLYGALGGAAFLVAMEARKEGRAEATVTVLTILVALGAWLGFARVSPLANADGASFLVHSADTLLAALFIGSLEGLFFALIPLRVLPGGRIKEWSWLAWGVLFAVVTYLFVHVLLAPSSGYLGRATDASTAVSIALFVLFAVISIVFWGYFKVRPTKEDEESPEPVDTPVPVGSAS